MELDTNKSPSPVSVTLLPLQKSCNDPSGAQKNGNNHQPDAKEEVGDNAVQILKTESNEGPEATEHDTSSEDEETGGESVVAVDVRNDEKASSTTGFQKLTSAETMALNDAYVALENMRKANLEVEFGGKAGIRDVTLFHEFCTACLHEHKVQEEEYLKTNNNEQSSSSWRNAFLHGWRRKKKSPPCLICASPVCNRHCCRDLKREGIVICSHCAPLFTMDFVVNTISNEDEAHRKECIHHMIDSYDRALLMLRYSCQFIDEIAAALEDNTQRGDKIGLGSSGIGIVAGITGVGAVSAQAAAAVHLAAAATVLSPAGPPLLIASILFGGTAAAVTTGSEAYNYCSEPNQLANKILALSELVHSLLAVTSVIKDALRLGHSAADIEHYMETRMQDVSSSGKGRFAMRRSSSSMSASPSSASIPDLAAVTVSTVDGPQEEEMDQNEITDKSQKKTSEESNQKDMTESQDNEDAEVTNEAATNTVAAAKGELANTDDSVNKEDSNDKADGCDDESERQGSAEEIVVSDKEGCGDETSGRADDNSEEEKTETTGEGSSDDVGTKLVAKAAMPLAPLIDDFFLTAMQVFSGSTGNASVAVSRFTTNTIKLAQVASIACGALSAATIFFEARNIKGTLKSLQDGSPCEKAQMLRKLKEEVEELPATKEIAEECMMYLRATAQDEANH
jgi:hypothetical protein